MVFLSFNAFAQIQGPGETASKSEVLEEDLIYFSNAKHRFGALVGYGDQNLWKIAMDVSYHYEAFFLQLQYYYVFHSAKRWDFEFIVVPQYQKTRYLSNESISNFSLGYEIGVNSGILFRYNMFQDKVNLYAMASIGPQFVSGTPDRQSDGFIFTDNFFAGMNLMAVKGLYVDFRSGFRHMSNAGLKSPNKGINNFVVYTGLMYNFH